MTMRTRSYSEFRAIRSYEDRFKYLALRGQVAHVTFGYDRYLNQKFYTSKEWRDLRSRIISRDHGCDLGVEGYEIHSRLYIHHMNPMGPQDLKEFNPANLDPEYLITVTHRTHNAIHYGDESLLSKPFVPRRSGDTKLW